MNTPAFLTATGLIASSLLLTGCGAGSSNDRIIETGTLSLSITDTPVDNVSAILII